MESLLLAAASEIKRLRSENQIMRVRLEMFDSMMLLFHTVPAYPGVGHSPDVVYDLEKQAEKLKADKE